MLRWSWERKVGSTQLSGSGGPSFVSRLGEEGGKGRGRREGEGEVTVLFDPE